MKKTFKLIGLVLLAVMSFGITACGSDDEDDGVDTTPITMIAGDEKTVQGADTISTSNKFVVYTSKNTVHGWHVGEATLLVNGKKTISVTVSPKYHLYNEPVLNWGCDVYYVKSHQKQGSLSSKSTNNQLMYEDAGAATALMYLFENGKLKSVGAMVSTNYTSQYSSFLAERYLMIPTYKGENMYFVGADAINLDDAKSVVMLQVYTIKYLMAVYVSAKEFSSTTRTEQVQSDILSQMKSIADQISEK